MIDIDFFINDNTLLTKYSKFRNINESLLQDIISFFLQKKDILRKIQNLQGQKNQLVEKIAILKNKINSEQEKEEIIAESNILDKEITEKQIIYNNIEQKQKEILISLPNILLEEVPFGSSENENIVIKTFGEKKHFSFVPLEHNIIGKNLGLFDFDRAVKISGSRFVIMKDVCARMERALCNFMLDICTKEFKHMEISVPYLINKEAAFFSGQLPKFEEEIFKTIDEKYLISTSEMSMVNIYSNEILNIEELPIRMCSYSPCFRKEAGSAGKDTKGILRQHQFNKVEIVSIVLPEKSKEEHERMLSCAETILQKLELPYRISLLCSGDTGFCAAKTFDIEVWLPGQNKYREICSASNTTSFQSRRAKIRFQNPITKKKEFPHMLNSSALPIGRTIIAIMENYQNSDGTFSIPDALKKYMQ